MQLLPCDADGLLAAPLQDARAAVQPLRGSGESAACQEGSKAACWAARGWQAARQAHPYANILSGTGH